jgi:hypothetical protein
MTSTVSNHAFAIAASVPLLASADLLQRHLAGPRLPARIEADAAFADCQGRDGVVMAALAGQSICAPTLVGALYRRHRVTYLCDTPASHAPDEMAADEGEGAVSTISGLYVEVCETARLDRRDHASQARQCQTEHGKLGNGMSAGG